MSLFVCCECNTIESTSCLARVSGRINHSKPNLQLMDAHGHGRAGPVVRMLCSKCNTGKWHNEFPMDTATSAELELASHSKFHMITPSDHPEGCIEKNDNARHGYVVNRIYATMAQQVKDALKEQVDDLFAGVNLVSLHPLYLVWRTSGDLFVPSCLRMHDIMDSRDIELAILDSQYTPADSVCTIYKNVVKMQYTTECLFEKLNRVVGSHDNPMERLGMLTSVIAMYGTRRMTATVPVKQQPLAEKIHNLEKAQLKRDIKLLKKKFHQGDEAVGAELSALIERYKNKSA